MNKRILFLRSIKFIAFAILIATPLFSQPSNIQNFENDIKQILSNVEKSIVSVRVNNTTTENKKGGPDNTNLLQQHWTNGVIYKDNYIILKNHNITAKSEITVTYYNGEQSQAEFVGCNDLIGLSIVLCQAADYTSTLSLFEEQPQVGPGNWVIYVGNSLGVSPAISLGMVNCIRGDGILQISSKIPAGSYGGPIFNSNSRLVGLLSNQVSDFTFEDNSFHSFSMEETILVDPISSILQIADEIIFKANQPWLGIGADTWPGHVGGVHIRQILPDSPAAEANLQIGDIILGVDGTNWHQATDMAEFIKTKKPGDSLQLEILRGNKKSTTVLEVASMRGEPFSFLND